MDDSIRTAKYYAPNYTALPTRQCLVCGTLENYSVSTTVVDASLPWLCDRCRETLLKLIENANTSNALNALKQENKEGKEEVTDRNVGKWQITDAYPHNVYCSECHKKFAQTHWAVWEDGSLPRNFCPNCGAKMESEGE